ncbi:MAG: PilZ domain-containing protein [Candidatus Omnitrophota bacterium]
MIEKRMFARFPAVGIKYEYASQNRHSHGSCKDISLGGVRIPEPVSEGENIFLKLFFQSERLPSKIEGQCVWSNNENSGIKFVNTASYRPTLVHIRSFIGRSS